MKLHNLFRFLTKKINLPDIDLTVTINFNAFQKKFSIILKRGKNFIIKYWKYLEIKYF